MAFCTIQYFSRSLEKASSVNVVFPDDPDVPRPWVAFYLLHGLSDDHTIWMRRTSVERYVEGTPMVLVMPDGGRGWYSNAAVGLAYEDDLIKDVVGLIDRTFPVKAERGGRAIGGLSMGGYGAVKNGLKHHDKFASVTSHSGAIAAVRDPESGKRIGSDFVNVFGEMPAGGSEDPFALVTSLDHGVLPKMRIDCGKDDFLLEQNRAFDDHLNRHQIGHEYEEFEGGHNWEYWDKHVREAIAFHRRNLGIA